MMRLLVLLHRWLGVSTCLLFAMWFATGLVMHFVPFPSLAEAERIDGLGPVDASRVTRDPAAAVATTGIANADRVRLVSRGDALVYVVSGPSTLAAVRADDLTSAAVHSPAVALTIAQAAARRRGLDGSRAEVIETTDYDQWTVPNGFDRYRPLHRIALNDPAGTELYVSAVTGEVVLDTTRRERAWNYAGSVTHWIYPTILRKNQGRWDVTVWWLSLIALVAAVSGSVLGVIRMRLGRGRGITPYRRWHAWHHILGLACMTFVLTWIFSGWLSMDHGRLFSTGKLTAAEASAVAGGSWQDAQMPPASLPSSAQAREIEWFLFDRKVYRRERIGLDTQQLASQSGPDDFVLPRDFLTIGEVQALAERLATGCQEPFVVAADDAYAIAAAMPTAPVYRAVCGDVWFTIDGASGVILERLDSSRRAYRWFYTALHTLNFPVLAAHPAVRSVVIVALCGGGFVFSVTGVVIGWRRLRRQVMG
jgi:uncharacterized iron-regulated membrane protein